MTMPAGVVKKTKNNDNKHYREHDEWMQGKKIGRKKQRWVNGDGPLGVFIANGGHWEKVN